MPFGQQSCIIRLNKKWTGRENSVSGVLCEVKNKEICCSEIQKTVGMTGFFKKSYKNIRTKNPNALMGVRIFLMLRWDSKGRHQSADWCKKCPVDTF